jgi:carbonic anhydrase
MRNTSYALIVCLVGIGTCLTAQDAKHGSHAWTYEGAEGPSHWGDLKPQFKTCKAGQRQSPIDIPSAEPASLPQIQFNYKDSSLRVVNNGHTIQFNFDGGSFVTISEKRYELKQFHFHHPSEEKIQGKGFDLVAHLVHADAHGHLAVIAVLFREGSSNPAIDKLWAHIPTEEGSERSISGQIVNAASLLPKSTGYYMFEGSLTIPPCSESVTWIVLKTPAEVSPAQVSAFATLYPNNARPTQPLNGRAIAESK